MRVTAVARRSGWAVAAIGALVAWWLAGTGFANYDTAYALNWGRDLAHGRLPDYSVPVAPTPHPLANLVGLVLSPLGDAAEPAWVAIGFVALGALCGLTFAVGTWAFGTGAGIVAAAIIVTREPVLSFGARAYVDIPYVAFLLWALLAALKRPAAGSAVLVPLTLAGLLRPEAWLFAAAYVAYRAATGTRGVRSIAALAALASVAPLLWLLADQLIAGNALHSLTGTRENAEALRRRTGLAALPATVPWRLGEILREPVLAAALLGGFLGLACRPRRARPLAAAGILALCAFAVLALAGLPILGRYLLAPATVLAVFAGAGVLGWTKLPTGHPWRRRWQWSAVVLAVAFAAFLPDHGRRLERLHESLALQKAIHRDLRAVAAEMTAACLPVGVPNHRPVPHLALWLDRPPSAFVSAQLDRLDRGQYLDPASDEVQRSFMLDPNDPGRLTAEVPPGFSERAGNSSWRLHERCTPPPSASRPSGAAASGDARPRADRSSARAKGTMARSASRARLRAVQLRPWRRDLQR